MRVLIGEDDLTSRTMLAAILRKWGYHPVVTSDGNATWDALQAPGAPKLVVLDWNMPGMDGLAVCRRARRMDTSRPPYIILLTARGLKEDIVRGLEAGANDYVAKPYDSEELRARIRVGQRMIELQSELNAARDALEHEALHDPLTGIFNRRAILTELRKELSRAKREGKHLSIGLCDIDKFKAVNDTYGHQVGDDVLRGAVERVRSHLRDYDHLGRYGGEEFLVVAPGSTGSAGGGPYERLRAAVAAKGVVSRKGDISVTISIGVAGGSGESAVDDMLAAADAALYEAKNDGRNRVAYASPHVAQSEPKCRSS